jgi:hypothetical protein
VRVFGEKTGSTARSDLAAEVEEETKDLSDLIDGTRIDELVDRAEEGRFKMPCVGDIRGLARGAADVASAACGGAGGACILVDARGDEDEDVG